MELEDYVFCGPSMVFTNVLKPRSEFPQRGTKYYHKTLVKKSASIGANVTIVCGNIIGRYSMIGSGSVVTKNVEDFSLVVGNPAKHIGWIDRKGNRLTFNDKDISNCGNFIIKDNKLVEIKNNKPMKRVYIIDYGICNIGSLKNMIKKIGFEAIVATSPSMIEKPKKIILPVLAILVEEYKILRIKDFGNI